MTSRSRPAPVLGLFLAASVASVLAGCGGSSTEAPAAPANPTDAELESWSASAGTDAKSIGEALAAKYKADKAFPSSADGLGTLSEGNRVGKYESTAQYAQVCVEHVRDGKAWVAQKYYVGVDGRVNPASGAKNTGCF